VCDTHLAKKRYSNVECYASQTIAPPEQLYATPSAPTAHPLNELRGLADLVHDSVFAVDSDHRAVLLQNIVLVGGGSTIPGLADRLNHELSLKIPGSKLKIHAPGNSIERRHSVWLGGSILASLGTFHQLWVGAEEWKEHGPAILAQRELRHPNYRCSEADQSHSGL
jgi:actin-related protein